MNFQKKLEKLRGLPEKTKRIIFWSTLAILGSIFVCLWFWHATQVLKNFNLESAGNLNAPATSTDIKTNVKEEEQNGFTGQRQEETSTTNVDGQGDQEDSVSSTTSTN